VVNGLLTAVIPFDGYARPILFSDGALIGSIVLPAYAVADVKLSGLFAGHLTLKFRSNVSAPTPSATYFTSSLTRPVIRCVPSCMRSRW
jgi:hypothetical protein